MGLVASVRTLRRFSLVVIVIIGVGQYSPGSPVAAPSLGVDDWRSDASQDKRRLVVLL